MKKNRYLSVSLTSAEAIWGFFYLAFELLALPALLAVLNRYLPRAMSSAELNFTYFGINFIAVLLIFHEFLAKNLRQLREHPAYFCQAVILGFVAYWACSTVLTEIMLRFVPDFTNMNDDSLLKMASGSFFLMSVGTVVLVPPVEECLFRGLIFRGLYGKSRWAAYLVSMAAFAFVHISGFIGSHSPLQLLLCFLQYLPAGLCLAWSYTKADTIFAPILIHAAVNAFGIWQAR